MNFWLWTKGKNDFELFTEYAVWRDVIAFFNFNVISDNKVALSAQKQLK